ncbi:MAG: rRNA maturation RNase YbeY [Myxococcales bacterium]|nr:rRNA maturation RNase YbeY [Myxococcales bacterium]
MLGLSVSDKVVSRLDEEWVDRLEAQLSRMVTAAWMSEGTNGELEAGVRLCDDEEMQLLNRDYRHKDVATDVLAFAQREGEGGGLCPENLGDVVISLDTAERQATGELYDEVIHLSAHGLCHLLGYDHQDDEEEAAMNARMKLLTAESEADGPVRAA